MSFFGLRGVLNRLLYTAGVGGKRFSGDEGCAPMAGLEGLSKTLYGPVLFSVSLERRKEY